MDDAASHNCAQCSHQAASVFQLDHHIKRKHRSVYAAELFHAIFEPEQFSCIHCDYKNHHYLRVYEHYKRAHGPADERPSYRNEFVEYPCHRCGYKSNSSLTLLKYHNLCEIVTEPLGTEVSDATFHESRGKIDRLQCTHCSYRAKRKWDMKSHMLYKHVADEEVNWFQCGVCPYRSRENAKLKMHHLRRHARDDEINWIQCGFCSYRSKEKATLKKHYVSRHAPDDEINWFRCEQCSYRAKRKAPFAQHMLKHAANYEVYRFRCDHCSYRAKRRPDLENHLLGHARDEEIDDWFCAKQKADLNVVKHHAEISWFRCCHCPYRSERETDLIVHMMQHAAKGEIN